ncbi:hypothetical protein ACWIE7_14555 [Dietzia sp. NPDC055343]
MMVRKIRARIVLQIRAEGLSGSAMAASQSMSRKSIGALQEAADATETSGDDVAMPPMSRCMPGPRGARKRVRQPDWEQVHREMDWVGVTLKLLHGEYTDRCATSGAPAMGYDQ